jgi:hypothetical protein
MPSLGSPVDPRHRRPRALLLALAVTLAGGLGAAAPAGAISGGAPVAPDAAPWLVTLSSGRVVCGGTLVAPDRVLTAAHCVQGVAAGDLQLRLGGGRWRDGRVLRWRGALLPPSYRILPSPRDPYDPGLAASVDDVAVLVLEDRVTDVAPLPVAADAPATGEATTTIGHGRTGPVPSAAPLTADGRPAPDPGAPSDEARARPARRHAPTTCGTSYVPELLRPAAHLCTLDPSPARAQACGGDSGSPVLVVRDGAPALAGVVTWGGEVAGRDCGEGLPDVSERVGRHGALLRRSARVLSPVASARPRVRRSGRIRTCDVGTWRPRTAKLTVTWWRVGPRRTVRGSDGKPHSVPGAHLDAGLRGRSVRGGSRAIGCRVTARTAGGWAAEESTNRR